MSRGKIKGGIILQVAVLFLLGVLTTGLLTYFSEKELSGDKVEKQTTIYAEEIADEMLAIMSDRDRWIQKKQAEEANARYNELIYYGLGEDDEDE